MSEVKVNKITPTTNCGTVTLGDSGDTLSIPSGATLSNAGSITNSGTITNTGTISGGTITGTIDNQVNWDTTAKTANFTAVAGNGYFVNTTSAAITVTLPASPSAGDLVGIKDYANTADTNNITIARNGSNIQGTANDFVVSTEGLSIILIYVDGTQGWVSTGAAKASDITEQATFIVATGGTITTCGNDKIHTFTGPGTFTVSSLGNGPTNPLGGPNNVDYLVVAGGGSAAGGGGGHRASGYGPAPLQGTALPVSATGYPVTVGAGATPCTVSNPGSSSIFSSITAAGGGGTGDPGGSGGGGYPAYGPAGTGNTPPVSPPQGNPGGPGGPTGVGGGGGATAAGGAGSGTGGAGGAGAPNLISGIACSAYAGGGGGAGPSGGGAGGLGGGGAGGPTGGTSGTANTGGGGGTNWFSGPIGGGGSGIVIIRYRYQ